METGAARWRVLEVDGATGRDTEPADPAAASGDGRTTSWPNVSIPVLLAGALALGLVGAGLCLVALGPTPDVAVDGGSRPAAVMSAIETASPRTDVAGATGASAGEVRVGGGADELVVDVAGAVSRPGVYRLPAGSRIADAIAAAGGFGARVDTARADLELNLAARVADGDRVRVPSRDDPGNGGADAGSAGTASAGPRSTGTSGGGAIRSSTSSAAIDINSATATELDALPGVGPVTAAKIVAGREEARYVSVDDLVTRKIVGAATMAKFRDRVVVR